MIDAKDLDDIAQGVADHLVDTAKKLGFKPKKKQEEGTIPNEVLVQIYDDMPQEARDFLRGHWGDEVWARYEAAVEEARV